jgi:putative membrane fusion protein
MKTSTKIALGLFLVVAIGLSIVTFVIPKAHGDAGKTVVIEYGDLPVVDKVELCLVRNETLFLAANEGAIEYIQAENAKVRAGVKILDIKSATAPEGVTAPGLDEVLAHAGEAAESAENNIATGTMIVSYYADGFEKIFTPERLADISKAEMAGAPSESTNLVREYTRTSEPLYKLTDNRKWYMSCWLPEDAGTIVNYDEGDSVEVDFNGTRVKSRIESITADAEDYKIVLSSDMYYEDMPKFRKIAAEIVFAEYQGLIVDAGNVVFRDEIPGVFVKQRGGQYKWVRINIIKSRSTGEKYIVSNGNFADAEGNIVSTVNYYDEILVKPTSQGYE